ncbi:iron complex transport system substrate-binding protein [Bacillus mesophilus]|uniref:Iron-siderophore ABC transporter substrate-binding protein n=1 Tax=Bacillus mesophilus TaxID=1808955 RepID=A0A6M0Q4B4_9BACI|nr:iron-siderophore ABC transporter substrate-binding protein [Bacillus mesophilus]MBM7660343.1 iron complex transport system substrate-binding protein [Bacillus mesophilus]NEY71054.1 iron-siderophore ABC transporter substrate-binding protein [Bacillus mesophilus]
MKAKLITLLMAILMVVMVGCSTEEASPEETENKSTNTETTDTEETNTEYPIVIKHAFGETVLEEKPERVATIAWSNHDVALALGVVPVGFSAANYGVQDGSGMLPWTAEKINELGEDSPNIYQDTDGLDFEAIADSNPDVILAAYSGITQEEYDTLSEIAPVIAYQTTPWVASWREQVTFNSMGMGMEEEGKQLIADTEKLIEEKASAFPDLAGKKAAFVSINAADLSKFYIYSPADPRGGFLTDELGMVYPESISSQFTDGSFFLEVSAENSDMLNDADIFVTYGNAETLATLQADPIYGKIPAVERGSVVVIEDNTPLAAAGTPSPLSIEATLDEYLNLLSEAVNKVK